MLQTAATSSSPHAPPPAVPQPRLVMVVDDAVRAQVAQQLGLALAAAGGDDVRAGQARDLHPEGAGRAACRGDQGGLPALHWRGHLHRGSCLGGWSSPALDELVAPSRGTPGQRATALGAGAPPAQPPQ